ncbi:MAG: hypothetical protein ILP13_08300 [Lachnospiraceae bacterium]|nr:hypothetical protein [Lachnospiraceae bacterium]
MNRKRKGSATVEALLILPVLITFILSVSWLFDLFRIHAEIGGVLNRVGNGMVTYSYAYDRILGGQISDNEPAELAASVGWSEIYLRNEVMKTDAAKYIDNPIFGFSRVFSDGEVSLSAIYYVKPPVSVPFFKGFLLKNSFYSRMYVGCIDEDPDEECVFITRTGKVYHTVKDCRALKTTVISVEAGQVGEKRNNSGAKYYPCEKCGKKTSEGILFITPYGNRYHTDRNCYEINTTIYEIPKSEAKGRRKCYFCP